MTLLSYWCSDACDQPRYRHRGCHTAGCECDCHGDPNQLDLLAVTE